MNCDICNKNLTEDDTHENIVCSSCMNAREKIHCIKCKCIVKSYKSIKRIFTFLKKKPSILGFALFLSIATLITFLINHNVGFKLGLGILSILLSPIWIFVVFMIPYHLSVWFINTYTKEKWGRYPDNFDRFIGWALGIILVCLPLIIYWLGNIIWYIISHHNELF